MNRNLIQSGELKRLIDNNEVTGVMPDAPLIAGCIAHDKEYRDKIRELAQLGMEAEEIYQSIVLEDLANAADQLWPVFKRTQGRDGFVGVDVSPEFAYDVEALIEEGCMLWEKANRPNVMIQVPATMEAMSAIAYLLGSGVNVNATLIHSLSRYRDVARAYLAGITSRLEKGMPVKGIASAATFSAYRQISRASGPDFSGRETGMFWHVSSYNALSANRVYRDVFQDKTFLDLTAIGVQPQLLMWRDETDEAQKIDNLSYAEDLASKFMDCEAFGYSSWNPTFQRIVSEVQEDTQCHLDVLQEEIIKLRVVQIDDALALISRQS